MAFPRPDTIVEDLDGADLIPVQLSDQSTRTNGSVDSVWYITFDDLVAAVTAAQ